MIPRQALVLVFALCAQNQCGGIADKAEYDRCLSRAGGTYDSYKRETER